MDVLKREFAPVFPPTHYADRTQFVCRFDQNGMMEFVAGDDGLRQDVQRFIDTVIESAQYRHVGGAASLRVLTTPCSWSSWRTFPSGNRHYMTTYSFDGQHRGLRFAMIGVPRNGKIVQFDNEVYQQWPSTEAMRLEGFIDMATSLALLDLRMPPFDALSRL